MSDKSKLKRLTVRVELLDGTVIEELPIRNPALVAWDFERRAKNWPTAEEAPLLWQTFVSWRQAKNDGRYAGEFAAWRDTDCLEIDVLTEDEPVTPTEAGSDS